MQGKTIQVKKMFDLEKLWAPKDLCLEIMMWMSEWLIPSENITITQFKSLPKAPTNLQKTF